MNTKSRLQTILTLIALLAAAGGGYALAGMLPDPGPASAIGLPPLSTLDLPSQTQNGITATLESYYADAARLVFAIRVSSDTGNYSLEQVSIQDSLGEDINFGYGTGPSDRDASLFLVDLTPVGLLEEKQLNGQLSFAVTAAGERKTLANFHFDLDIPIHPALTYNPKQTVWANGIEILLDRLVISPANTQAYLCYTKPTDADWAIGHDATLRVNGKVANMQTYGILFDSAFGDLGKGGEPDWTPPVEDGRCVKIGFPIGDTYPDTVILTIPALEQSLPEVIPAEDLAKAYEILKAQGIDMEWHTVDHGAYLEYKNLPAGVNETVAFHKFIEALGYIHKGPWMFKLQLSSRGNSDGHPMATNSRRAGA